MEKENLIDESYLKYITRPFEEKEPEIVPEMQKLRDMLDKKKIEWKDCSSPKCFTPICRTRFMWGGHTWSVINGVGSFGGYGIFEEENEGLLEAMDLDQTGEPIGYLKANDVFRLLEAAGDKNE